MPANSASSSQPSELDRRYVWHPFTQMKDWLRGDQILIVEGQGSILRDQHGREYLDANSSIWTNLHGHRNRAIDRAVKQQLGKIAHSSALGLANEPASVLAERLVSCVNPSDSPTGLAKVFYSDDGSTAVEAALKLSYQYWKRQGVSEPHFLSLEGGYHGDSIGAVSLGHIDLFHQAYGGLLFKTASVMAPYCYRCPYNRAAPERADARAYRKCNWECVGKVEEKFAAAKLEGKRINAFVVEPLMQGAAGMIPQPPGWLRQISQITRDHGAHLIVDEVMTGFGRVSLPTATANPLFASQVENAEPDFMAVAKGLTGGYLPMAGTLTTQAVFDAFLGEYDEFKTFFHGHSYTGNQLGAAAAIASLQLLGHPKVRRARASLARAFSLELQKLWGLEFVGDIRQAGLIAGIELVRNWRTRESFHLHEQVGIRVCQAMARRGVLTRPIGSVIVLMPPYCTTRKQLRQMIAALFDSVAEVLGPVPG